MILAVATLTYVVGMIFRLPCRITVAGQVPDAFRRLCYSDIGLLYADRGLLQGNTPYLDSGSYQVLEYPVLTGWFLELERRITGWLGAPSGTDLTAQQAVDATLTFVDVNQVLLGALFLVAVWAQVHTPGRPAVGRDDAGRRADRRRRVAGQLGPAARRPHRGGRAGLEPPPPRPGRGPARARAWRPSSTRSSCSARCSCCACARRGCGRTGSCSSASS